MNNRTVIWNLRYSSHHESDNFSMVQRQLYTWNFAKVTIAAVTEITAWTLRLNLLIVMMMDLLWWKVFNALKNARKLLFDFPYHWD